MNAGNTTNKHTNTMANTIELRQKRARIIEQMRDAVTKGEEARASGDATKASDYDTTFERAEADERELSKLIDRQERLESLEKEEAGKHLESIDRRQGLPSGDKGKEYRDAYKAWFTNGSESLTPDQRSILSEKRGTSNQVVGTTTLGGYLVPQGFLPELEIAMKAYSGIFQAADIFRTDSGNALLIPTEDDTTTEANLIAEAAAITVQDLTIGQKQMDAYKYATQMKLSWELMQDSAFDMDGETRRVFGPRFGRAINTSCTTGDGSGKPNGVVTASTLGKTSASATAITFNEIVDLFHSVDPAYRESTKTGFMLHDNILAAIKKIQLGTGDITPLWQTSVRDGDPDTILGKQYWVNQAMSSALTTGLKVMLFGDFSKYRIRLVQDLLMLRLNERYADNGLVGYIGYMRWDGECVNTAAIKHLITA